MTTRILIVEDEKKLANILMDYFMQANYQPYHIDDGALVIDWVKKNNPQVILLDIMLPNENGIALCKAIRQFSDIPILMLTAKVEEEDRLLGLELGADDYICKPFSPREVVARVKTILRRVNKSNDEPQTLTLDKNRLTVSIAQQQVQLTLVEFHLLKNLVTKPHWVFSREQLMNQMYNDERFVNDRTIDSHIKKIRKKLASISDGKNWIKAVYGTGYRLNTDD